MSDTGLRDFRSTRDPRATGRVHRGLRRSIWMATVLCIAALPVAAIHVSVAAAPGDAGSGFPAMGPVLWSADNETGDLSQWTENQYGEAVFNSASASLSSWFGLSHSGKRSLQLSITDAGSQGRAA